MDAGVYPGPALSLCLWPWCRGGITGNRGFLSPSPSSCGQGPSPPATAAAVEKRDGRLVRASVGERRVRVGGRM